MNVYKAHGYESRFGYLQTLSFEWDIPLDVVCELSCANGPSEDFDGLLSLLEDWREQHEHQDL